MKISVNNNPTYTLELSQEEFLVLFEALGDRTVDQWNEYKERHNLTVNECEHLKAIGVYIYGKLEDLIIDQVNPNEDDFFMSDKWLAQQYKEKYNGNQKE